SGCARGEGRGSLGGRLLIGALARLGGGGLGGSAFARLRCLELLIVKGWANKDVAKYLDLTEQAVASYKFQTVGRLKEMARRAGLSLEDLGAGGERGYEGRP